VHLIAHAPSYQRTREICNAHGVLYIADDIMWHGPHWQPVYTTMTKGMGAGYLLIVTVMATEKSLLSFWLVQANCGTRTRTSPMRLPVQGLSR
jgi:adenosylmethionine-8-amino-7-oxononanoate aminotransferase